MFLLPCLYLSLCIAQLISAQESLKNVPTSKNLLTIIRNIVPIRSDGKIAIASTIKHVKLDIGLSYNAPMSQHWLSHEDDLMVFGFEPNPACVAAIMQGATKRHPAHGDPLDKKYIGEKFFLIPCALGISASPTAKFYVTKDDCGCSSIYFPKQFNINQILEVPIFSLADFFEIFPFDTHPVIDYIKIDAQGSDLNIVKSAGNYLTEHVIYITLEAENSQYVNTVNSYQDMDTYMKSIGFIPFANPNTNDPTYFNPRYTEYIKKNRVQIYQKG